MLVVLLLLCIPTTTRIRRHNCEEVNSACGCFGPTVFGRPKPQHPRASSSLVLTAAAVSDDDDDDTTPEQPDNDLETLLNSVTDAEALLACRAHLQRTNQLGAWTQAAARRKRREKEKGFFWDDAVIYRSNNPLQSPHQPREAPEEEESATSNHLLQSIEGTSYALERMLRTDTDTGTIINGSGDVLDHPSSQE